MLSNANRWLRGAVPYRDYFQPFLPGTDIFYSFAIKLFGNSAIIPGLTLTLLGTLTSVLVFQIARNLLSRSLALLCGLLFLVCPFSASQDATHHWFSTLGIAGATLALVQGQSRSRLLLAGLLCGLATWFTDAVCVSAIVAICVWLAWRERTQGANWKRVAASVMYLLIPAIILVFGLCGYLVAEAGSSDFFKWAIAYPLKYYRVDWYNNFQAYFAFLPPHKSVRDLPLFFSFFFVHLALPLVYIIFLVRVLRSRNIRGQHLGQLMLIEAVGVGLLLPVIPSPTLLRLSTVAFPAVILFVYLIAQPGTLERMFRAGAWIVAISLSIAWPLSVQLRQYKVLTLSSGRVEIADLNWADSLAWMDGQVHTGETMFGNPPMIFALGMRNPAPLDFVTPSSSTLPEQVSGLISSLETESVQWIVLRPSGLVTRSADSENRLIPLLKYLHSHYKLVKVLPTSDEVYERQR